MSSLPAKLSVQSRYTVVRANATAIIAAIWPGGAMIPPCPEATLTECAKRFSVLRQIH
jgi:hypothetical protein